MLQLNVTGRYLFGNGGLSSRLREYSSFSRQSGELLYLCKGVSCRLEAHSVAQGTIWLYFSLADCFYQPLEKF